MLAAKETRKGPWTAQEDMRLVFFVGLLGDRRWDAIARASGSKGLRRTGKSCRLRWVNYLRPGLKRGRMSSQEERLIIDLHARWGNRWSRIAKRLPGRTDNEIKNYWRTHTRKKAKEKRTGTFSLVQSSSSPSSSSLSSSPSSWLTDEMITLEGLSESSPLVFKEPPFQETGNVDPCWRVEDDYFGLVLPDVPYYYCLGDES